MNLPNTKTILIIAGILILFLGYQLFQINNIVSKTKMCREILELEDVNYQKADGEDSCCYNIEGKYTCKKMDVLIKGNDIIDMRGLSWD